jgi:hypothetical protein
VASPSLAEVETQISNVARIQDNLRQYCGTTASTNFIDNQDTLVQSLETDYAGSVTGALDGMRAALNSAVISGASVMNPLFTTMGQVIDAPETDTQAIITRLYTYMIDNAYAVTSRGFTFGTPAAGGSNSGDGSITRLTVDENGLDIENTTPELEKAEIVADQFSGSQEGEQVFQFIGSDPAIDQLKIAGSGRVQNIRCVTSRDSVIGNASFTNYQGTTAVPTSITDWTVGTIADVEIDTTNFYVADPSDGGVPAALKFTGNTDVAQAFTVRNVTLDPFIPYKAHIWYNREVGTGDGTLTFTFCGVSASVVLAAQTGWNKLEITVGQNCWFKNFNTSAADMQVKVELSGNTTGSVLVDSVIACPFSSFDGLYYLCEGGQTPFLVDDSFSWTDSATEAILQRFFWINFGRYLPHATGGSVTWADPT